MIWFTEARKHDHMLLEKLKTGDDLIYVFDMGYVDDKMYLKFCLTGTGFVTRLKDSANYDQIAELDIEDEIHTGVIKDEIIEVNVKLSEGKMRN